MASAPACARRSRRAGGRPGGAAAFRRHALFSSDSPHVEGGRNPIKRFEASLGGADEATRDRFYRGNFADLMGRVLVDRGLAGASR